jgi:hypothetical protein
MSAKVPDRPLATQVRCSADELIVLLVDGRELHVPLEWFATLREARPEQLANHRLIGGGVGIHWPDLDEDLSVQGLLAAPSPRLAGRGAKSRPGRDAGAPRTSPRGPRARHGRASK